MIPVPDPDWLAAANHTHEPVWAVDLLDRYGAVLAADLPFVDGQYTVDRNRVCDLSIDVPADPVPGLLSEDYLPLAHRLRVRYRIGPASEWITVADVDIVDSALARPENVWTFAASDQTRIMALDDLARGGLTLTPSMTVAAAIEAIIRRTYPAAQITITGRALTDVLPSKYDYQYDQGSPWNEVQQLALSSAASAWQDPSTRVFHVADVDTAAPAVDALAVGDGGQIHRYTVQHQRAYNTSILTYIDDTPNPSTVVGVYEDRRPTSPVSIDRIGSRVVLANVTRDVPFDNMPTQAQADAAAAVAIVAGGSLMRDLEVIVPCRPWLQPGDYVTVDYLGGPTQERQRIREVSSSIGSNADMVVRMWSNEYTVTPTSQEAPDA